MLLPGYLGLLRIGEQELAASFRAVHLGHATEADVFYACGTLAAHCDEHLGMLQPFIERYGETDAAQPAAAEPGSLAAMAVRTARPGSLGLLRDLHDLYALASFVSMSWTMVQQAGSALRDPALLDAVSSCSKQTAQQLEWLQTRMKQAAAQTLVAAAS